MEAILDRTKGLFENQRKCRVGIDTLHSSTFVSQKFCKSLLVIATQWRSQEFESWGRNLKPPFSPKTQVKSKKKVNTSADVQFSGP